MSFAQGTQNYDLPQYVATDVPSWITDITNAFQKIDTQMKLNQDAIAELQSIKNITIGGNGITAGQYDKLKVNQ